MLQPYTVGRQTRRLDHIAKLLYGSEQDGTVAALPAASPGLAALGPFVPRGTVLQVPAPPAPPKVAYVLPWG